MARKDPEQSMQGFLPEPRPLSIAAYVALLVGVPGWIVAHFLPDNRGALLVTSAVALLGTLAFAVLTFRTANGAGRPLLIKLLGGLSAVWGLCLVGLNASSLFRVPIFIDTVAVVLVLIATLLAQVARKSRT
jgi:hypothetical protein